MAKKIQLYEITMEQLADVVSAAVKKELSETAIQMPIKEENLLTRKDAAKLLQVSDVTLWRYVKDGVLKQYKNLGRAYFKKDEIMEVINNS